MTAVQSVQETILVVEDDVLIRMPIADYLRDCGYRVIEAVSADEAMSVLMHQETQVDIVFSDIEMPGSTDGFGLSKWIRDNRPGIDVILTGTVPRALRPQNNYAMTVLCRNLMSPRPCTITFVGCSVHA